MYGSLAAAIDLSRLRRSRRRSVAVVAALCAVVFALFATSAYAAATVYYWSNSYGTLCTYSSGCGVTKTPEQYRNFNDSCSSGTAGGGRNFAWTRVVYALDNGSWHGAAEAYDYCNGVPAKAHLGPSSNYGETYVDAKCHNTDTVSIWETCWTTVPG